MDLSTVRARRKKSHFRPWNSYLAKKATAESAIIARDQDVYRDQAQRGLVPPRTPVVRLTTRLIDTYEGINANYYQRKQQIEMELNTTQNQSQLVQETWLPAPASSNSSNPSLNDNTNSIVPNDLSNKIENKNSTQSTTTKSTTVNNTTSKIGSSPLSVQYCDQNHDYIVRTGETFNNRYMLEKVIGRGSFGQVVRAFDTRDNTHVAIKIIKNNAMYVEHALSEVRMTSYLNRIDPEDVHSIMRLRDKFIFRGHQCLVLELLSFSLYDLLRNTQFYGVSLNLVRKFCKQILKCLSFLARPDVNIAHCDLKPENVLLRHPQRSTIKVVDFGSSCRISESMFVYVQSRFYRAPEVILGLPYNTQVDVWSLGCMLLELHTGYPVFAGKDEADQMSVIVYRLGIPPKEMLDRGKKTNLFFDKDPITGEWNMKPELLLDPNSHETRIPGGRPIDAFVDSHTAATNGRRKRVSGGHSEVDYEIFLSLACRMLLYDPEERITAKEALEDRFVKGSSIRSGRDSPPPIPEMSTVGDHIEKDLDPGRKAPVQRMRKEVSLNPMVTIHEDPGLSDVSDVTKDVGGKLRLSKSEPAFDPLPKQEFVFPTSDWAEEVGIEPPPWRAAAGRSILKGPPNAYRNLAPAGCGHRLDRYEKRRKRVPCLHTAPFERKRSSFDVTSEIWDYARMTNEFSFGVGDGERATIAKQDALREVKRFPQRILKEPILPCGHGNRVLLYVPEL